MSPVSTVLDASLNEQQSHQSKSKEEYRSQLKAFDPFQYLVIL